MPRVLIKLTFNGMSNEQTFSNYGFPLLILLVGLSPLAALFKAQAGELIINGPQSKTQPDTDGIVIIHPQLTSREQPTAAISPHKDDAQNEDAFVWIGQKRVLYKSTSPSLPGQDPPTDQNPYLPQRRQSDSAEAPSSEQSDGSPPKNDSVEAERLRIIAAGIREAKRTNTTFRCAASVQIALQDAGHPEFMQTGDGWPMREAFLNSSKWQVTNDPYEATAFVRSWTDKVVQSYGDRYQGRNLGHVGLIYSRNNQLVELSDHEQIHDPNNKRYSETIYFKFVG